MNIKDSYIHNGTAVLKDVKVENSVLKKILAGKDANDAYLDWETVCDLTGIKPKAAGTADKVGHKLTFSGGVTGTWDGSADKTVAIPTKSSWNYDDVYLKLTGNGTTNPITGTIYIKDVNGIILNSKDKDLNIWEVYGNSGAWTSQYGFNLQYTGTGSGNNNDLILWAHNQTGTHVESYRVKQDGTFIFKAAPKVGTNVMYHAGNLTASVIGGLGTLSNNISGNAATATNADKLGNIAANNYFKHRDAVFNSEWSGKYLWTLWDNHLYAADKRFAVTLTGTDATNLSYLFDGSFESSVSITETKAVLHIKHTTAGNVWTSGLPYGSFYVVFYNSDAENVTGRVYCNYDGQGIGWHDLAVTHVRPHVWELNNGYYQLSDLEITITKPTSSVSIQLCQVLHEVTRSSSPNLAAVMSKYCNQKTDYSIEAAKFVKSGGTSSQFLKADGSVDSNTYSKSDHKHSFSDITPGVATIGDGANRLMFRTNSSYKNGIYYSTPGNEALVFGTIDPMTSWIFATTDPTTQTAWTSLTPSLQIKHGRVTINKLIANSTDASYNLDVNGSANATTLYENGVRVSVNGHTHDDRYYTESEVNNLLANKSNTSHTHSYIVTQGDTRSTATKPNDYNNRITFAGLKTNSTIGRPSTSTYSYVVGLRGWSDTSGGKAHELAFNDNGIFHRIGATDTWEAWAMMLTTANYNSYAPSLTGSGASGTWGINVTGNAATATKLQTARTIWGQSFDGTGNVSGALTGVTDITASGNISCSNLILPLDGKIHNGGNYGLYISGSAGDYGSAIYLTHDHGKNQTAFRIHSHYDSNLGGLTIGFSTTTQNYGESPINATYDDILHIRGNGNIGIGITSPSYKLHVVGDIYTTTGFKKKDSSDSYVLLGGGGHKLVSDFSMTHDHPYLPLSGGTLTGNIEWQTDSHGIYLYRGCGIEKWSGYGPTLVAEGDNTDFWIRNGKDRDIRYLILHTGNYTSYTVKKDGTGASGTWGINITGNAKTATNAGYATSAGNADTVDNYHAMSAGSLFYKYEVTATIPASSVTGDFWYATITFERSYVRELTRSMLDASYSNIQGQVYLNTYEYNGAWYAFTTNYNGCNIKGINYNHGNNPTYYIKLAKPKTYNNTLPAGKITVYSPYNCTIEVSTTAPSGVTFTNINCPGFTNLKANSAYSADSATTSTYASNVGSAGTAGTNYVTASKVISACNWYDTMIGSDSDTIINRWSEIVSFVAGFKETPDLATFLSNNYLAKAGGTMTGPLKWANATALPPQTSPQYFLCIDAFDDGGTTKWASKADTLKALTGLASTAIGDSDEPVYWNGSKFVKAGAYPTKSSWNYDDRYLKLSGGTMTGVLTLTSGTNAAYDKTALSFIKNSDKTEQARIGTDMYNGLGLYSKGSIYIRPNVTLGSASSNGLVISSSSFTYNGTDVALVGHTHNNYVTTDTDQTITASKIFKMHNLSTDTESVFYNIGLKLTAYGDHLKQVAAIGMGHEPQNWYKAAIGFERTGSYDRGDIVFLFNNISDSTTCVYSDIKVRIKPTGNISTLGSVSASGFIKTDSSDSYVLLGAGGHKLLSDFSMSHNHPYLPLSGGTMSNTNVVTNLNADLLDGYHEISFYRHRGSYGKSYTAASTEYNLGPGTYTTSEKGFSGTLLSFNSSGSASSIQFWTHYRQGNLYYRTSVDSSSWGKTDGSWTKILDSDSYTEYTVKKDGTGATGTWGISITGNAKTATNVAWSGVTDKPAFTTWSETSSKASYSLSNASWTNTITLPTTAGSYILNIVSGNSTLTGVFSIGASDNAKDEISLHLHGNGPRLYARTNGTTLQLSSNDASATSRSVTIKYRRMI